MKFSSGEQWRKMAKVQRTVRYLSLQARSANTSGHARSLRLAASSLGEHAFPVSFPGSV
ncbi:hypothetical protein A2U01_0112832 [Trifolium medium]|uniref:Uncharacterized protein n=1 Tax=Trifolium medium TaxID=97028 RepID=A0A392VT11_9FABA|nr:hypothetical protein [Trifolium medium]